MPAACTSAAAYPSPPFSDDLVPKIGTFYTLSQTLTCRLKKQPLSLPACIR